MGRDAERDRDPDDWFDEPDTSAVPRRGRSIAETEGLPAEPEAATEDWLRAPDTRTRAGTGPVSTSAKLALGAAALGVALVVGLLLGGVFDPGSSPSVTTPTTSATTPSSSTTPKKTTTTPTAAAVPVPTTPLAPGDEGPAVAELQRALARAGFSVGTIDGTYGPATKNAVAQFQASMRLSADGIAGAKTLAALNAKLNRP
jgi:hypothetical protein